MSNASTSNMNIYTLNKIYRLKLKTLSNLTTENTIIQSKLKKHLRPNLVLKMCKFCKIKIDIYFLFLNITGQTYKYKFYQRLPTDLENTTWLKVLKRNLKMNKDNFLPCKNLFSYINDNELPNKYVLYNFFAFYEILIAKGNQ